MKRRYDTPLRLSRSLLILTTLAAGMALAYLPARPGVAIAETADTGATSSPVPSVGETPDPGLTEPETTAQPTPETTAQPTPETTAQPTPETTTEATPEPTAEPTLVPTLEATAEPTAEPTTTPSPEPSLDLSLSISHVTAGRVSGPDAAPDYGPPDTPLTDQPRYEVFRLRFEVTNTGTADYLWIPTLEFAPANELGYVALPAGAYVAGVPFYAAPEWVRKADGGTAPGPAYATVPENSDAPDVARSTGINPMPAQSIRAGATMTIEFSVRATSDAAYLAEYLFRVTDAAAPLGGDLTARVVLEARPPIELTPGQRSGVPAGATTRPPSETIHSPSYALDSDVCAACHRAHTAAGSLLNVEPTQYALCVSCHNGTGAGDVTAAYSSAPANEAAVRAYYQHDPTQISEAPGSRGNDCADCHNPHDATATPAAPGSAGWSASGRTYGASGAAVTNNPPGAPTYALVNRVTLEYQLCFKCHSGAATLLSNSDQPASRYALDKGVEFDPNNASYHPIESAGTNSTAQMANSLLGDSPYKLWNFTPTSTIRCVNCHADASIASSAIANNQAVAAGTDLPLHASPERGILIASYQDRTLNGPLEAYHAADFALCYVCHAEAPFVDASGSIRVSPADTNFRYHGLHVSGLSLVDHGSPGTNIDTASDGGGRAICAECHFRIHSSAFPVSGQAPGPRLVNFAPNVTAPSAGTLNWQPRTDTGSGTCTLKCHGQPHNAVAY